MPVTDEKELKRYLSSEAYKNEIRPLKLDWAQAAGRLLQMVIHGEMGLTIPIPRSETTNAQRKRALSEPA